MHSAAYNGKIEDINLLDINKPGKNGQITLMIACRNTVRYIYGKSRRSSLSFAEHVVYDKSIYHSKIYVKLRSL